VGSDHVGRPPAVRGGDHGLHLRRHLPRGTRPRRAVRRRVPPLPRARVDVGALAQVGLTGRSRPITKRLGGLPLPAASSDRGTQRLRRSAISMPRCRPIWITRKDPMAHSGRCFCGAIELEVAGTPAAMGYCHCASCRAWSAAPVNAFTLWAPDAVRVTKGAEHLATSQKSKFSQRRYCTKCGGHLMTNHPTIGLVDVYAATIPSLPFRPGVHVNYA